MELAHDREHLEHLLCGSRCAPPVLATEGDLGDLLPRAEAVVYGAPPKTLRSQPCVNAAAEVWVQMGAWLSGGFGDPKICRGGERGHDTAQAEAALAVSSQAEAITTGSWFVMLSLLRHSV